MKGGGGMMWRSQNPTEAGPPSFNLVYTEPGTQDEGLWKFQLNVTLLYKDE